MENKSTAIWKWSVLLLTLLNVALLATIWLKSDMGRRMQDDRHKNFLAEQLHFTAEQTKRFDELRTAHHDSIEVLHKQERDLHDRFFENLKNPNVSNDEINQLAKAISDQHAQVELVTYTHFKKVRELCDDKQKVIFDRIIGDVLKRMGQRPPKDGGPPPDRH